MEVSSLTQQQSFVTTPPVTNQHVQGATLSPTEDNSSRTQMTGSVAPSTDKLSITSGKSIIVQQVVSQQLEVALEINSPSAVRHNHHNDEHKHDHEHQNDDLANRVIHKIHDEHKSKAHGMSDDERHGAAVQSVRVKVEQAFVQATTVLSGLGVMDESAVENVEQIHSQLTGVIDQEAATGPTQGASVNTAPAVDASMVNAASANRELSTALQVTTRDGDVVTIDISRSQALSAGSAEGANGSLVYAGASSSSQLEISVQGELSEKESKSISKVIESVNELVNKMFNGKTGDAMEKLSEFKINTKQLASMSLHMSSSVSYAAVNAYTQVSRLPLDAPAASPAASPAGTDAVNNQGVVTASAAEQTSAPVQVTQNNPTSLTGVQMARQAADVVNNAVDTENFENPFNEIRNLFAKIADMFAVENSLITTGHKDFIKELFNDVVDRLEDNAEADDPDEEVQEVA